MFLEGCDWAAAGLESCATMSIHVLRRIRIVAAVFLSVPCMAQVEMPAPAVEISAERPLLLFQGPAAEDLDGAAYGARLVEAWNALPERFRPLSCLIVTDSQVDVADRTVWFGAVLKAAQEASVPVALQFAERDLRRIYPLDFAEELVAQYSMMRGVYVTGLRFNEYYEFGPPDPLGVPPQVTWLVNLIDLAGRYGRFVAIQLDELEWPRIMANTWCRPLFDKIEQFSPYVVALNDLNGMQNITRVSALLGMWLEGSLDQWGVGARSSWYHEVRYLEPGKFGVVNDPPPAPSWVYRASVLIGAMAGARIYAFNEAEDLWFGSNSAYWDEAIRPTLNEILNGGFVARRRFVQEKARVAYQMTAADTPLDFHRNLRDIDAIYDEGLLLLGAYGMERPGQVAELVPDSGRFYWIPILSPYARQEALAQFDEVVSPGRMTGPDQWTQLLEQHYRGDGEGEAFITRIGRAVFVMHTRESGYEAQTFRVPDIPRPVRQLTAARTADGALINWPLREGDVSYSVYRRRLPDSEFEMIAEDVDVARYEDTYDELLPAYSYSVSALTNESEFFEGMVNWGDHSIVSTVYSRLAEEVALSPGLDMALSVPITKSDDLRPEYDPWWPTFEGVDESNRATAETIVNRIVSLEWAFGEENLNQVMDLYATTYRDPQGWGFEYVRRAFQWFFERYDACKMDRQIREWDFSGLESDGEVKVRLYCRFWGVALTDSGGRFADIPAHFPRITDPPGPEAGETVITFAESEGAWRIVSTSPALPNFRDILSFSTGPYDDLTPGPDQ